MAQPMKHLKSQLEQPSAKDKAEPACFLLGSVEPEDEGWTPFHRSFQIRSMRRGRFDISSTQGDYMTEIVSLREIPGSDVCLLMRLCEPLVRARGETDYWAYGRFFGSTSFAARASGRLAGVLVAYLDQDKPREVYLQDLAVAPDCRGRGIGRLLLRRLESAARTRRCQRIWLTSGVDNAAAIRLWASEGFNNLKGDIQEQGLWLVRDLKGSGHHRAVFEKQLLYSEVRE